MWTFSLCVMSKPESASVAEKQPRLTSCKHISLQQHIVTLGAFLNPGELPIVPFFSLAIRVVCTECVPRPSAKLFPAQPLAFQLFPLHLPGVGGLALQVEGDLYAWK